MRKLDPTFYTVAIAAVLAIAASVILNQLVGSTAGSHAQKISSGSAHAANTSTLRPVWAASATGRVEPRGGEVRIAAEIPARIVEVIATTNDRVAAGDLLVRLDSSDLMQKLIAAEAEAEVRVRERDEDVEEAAATGPALDRRKAEDALYAADQP